MATVGAPAFTSQACCAGVPSVFPAGSVARTSKVCGPSASGPAVTGLVQGAQAPPSSRHWKVEPGSSAENSKSGVGSLDGSDGVASSVVSGAVVSTVQACCAGVPSVVPAPSVARTSKVWGPSASGPTGSGLVQGAQAPPSTRHSNVEPASSAENAKLGVSSLEGSAGAASSVVSGASVSTVHAWEAGVGSGLPAASVARTSKVWPPSASGPTGSGLVQGAQAPPSSRHWKVEPASLAENWKLGEASALGSAGAASMVVCGA